MEDRFLAKTVHTPAGPGIVVPKTVRLVQGETWAVEHGRDVSRVIATPPSPLPYQKG